MQSINMPVVYLSGPMSGIEDCNRAAFHKAKIELMKNGYRVLSPADLAPGMQYEEYMQICLQMVAASQMLVLLPGWEKSDGAKAEYAYYVCLRKNGTKTKLEPRLYEKMFENNMEKEA